MLIQISHLLNHFYKYEPHKMSLFVQTGIFLFPNTFRFNAKPAQKFLFSTAELKMVKYGIEM